MSATSLQLHSHRLEFCLYHLFCTKGQINWPLYSVKSNKSYCDMGLLTNEVGLVFFVFNVDSNPTGEDKRGLPKVAALTCCKCPCKCQYCSCPWFDPWHVVSTPWNLGDHYSSCFNYLLWNFKIKMHWDTPSNSGLYLINVQLKHFLKIKKLLKKGWQSNVEM